jgi:hypothetical protein
LGFVGHAGDGFVGEREVGGEEFVEDGRVAGFFGFGAGGYGGDFDFEILDLGVSEEEGKGEGGTRWSFRSMARGGFIFSLVSSEIMFRT